MMKAGDLVDGKEKVEETEYYQELPPSNKSKYYTICTHCQRLIYSGTV